MKVQGSRPLGLALPAEPLSAVHGFGNRSKASLSDLAFDKIVSVETSKRDRYGRKIGKVLVDGRYVNLVQIERGMA